MVLTLIFSTVSRKGSLKPSPGCAGADHGARAQQDAALGLIDRVPASQYAGENE